MKALCWWICPIFVIQFVSHSMKKKFSDEEKHNRILLDEQREHNDTRQRAINQFINMKNDISHWHWSNICCLLRVATAKHVHWGYLLGNILFIFHSNVNNPQNNVIFYLFIQWINKNFFFTPLSGNSNQIIYFFPIGKNVAKDQWIVKSDLTLQLFVILDFIHVLFFWPFFLVLFLR